MYEINYNPEQAIQEADVFLDEEYHIWFCNTFGYDTDNITCMEWVDLTNESE